MVIDLRTDPAKIREAWTHFREVSTKAYEWRSLIPEGTQPPIHMNVDKMVRYRPQRDALRYDPTQFDTYLEQLGIECPTVRGSQQDH